MKKHIITDAPNNYISKGRVYLGISGRLSSKVLIANIPILYIIMLGLSLVSEFIYYINFGINITEYIVVSDVVTLFFDDLLFLMYFFIIIIFILSFIGLDSLDYYIFNKINNRKIVTVLVLLVFIFFIFRGLFFVQVVSIIVMLLITLILINHFIVSSGRYLTIINYIILIFGMAISISFFNASRMIRRISKGHANIDSIQLKNGDVLKSNNHLYSLGSTSGYFFIYNSSDSSKMVINKGEIRSIIYLK
ncbi:hypothetical protein [Fulvivirga sediminis]|uniref:Uncharacterized protein n=1 Tax=Fulvivirga sediminis TaxID=2803949 RepID=A0A937K0B6_9BACT|nr:hypothetical protein [Fulvivirga sediminis]MBL3656140.1 hypothetical protein [Fulvivirga sediminis]